MSSQKSAEKCAIFDHMILDGHKASFDNFSILLRESNAFKLKLKESLLISRDKPILNKNIYLFPLELFDYNIIIFIIISVSYVSTLLLL